MRHENRYPFAHLFGFAGLFVDEMIMSVLRWWHGLQAPYFLPHVWYAMLMGAFGVGGAVGIGLALWTLSVRGLL